MNDSDKHGLLGEQRVAMVASAGLAVFWSIRSLFDPNLGEYKLAVRNQPIRQFPIMPPQQH